MWIIRLRKTEKQPLYKHFVLHFCVVIKCQTMGIVRCQVRYLIQTLSGDSQHKCVKMHVQKMLGVR